MRLPHHLLTPILSWGKYNRDEEQCQHFSDREKQKPSAITETVWNGFDTNRIYCPPVRMTSCRAVVVVPLGSPAKKMR